MTPTRRAPLLACFALLLAGPARAEIGAVDPAAWGARFDAGRVRRAVFCVAKRQADGECATAFLIDPRGYVLTAHHVEPPSDPRHGAKTDLSLGEPAKEALFDYAGRAYRAHLVKYLEAAASDKPFVKDPAKLLRAKFEQRFRGVPAKIDILSEISPDNYQSFDVVLLKIDDADLPRLAEAGIEPLALADGAPARGERVFLAGYPWRHYPDGYFSSLAAELAAAHPDRPPRRATDGGFSFLTGVYDRTQALTVVTQAAAAQTAGQDPDTDAVDSFWGSSGSPLLDADGRVLGVHWGSDNVAADSSLKASITFATSSRAIRDAFALAELGL